MFYTGVQAIVDLCCRVIYFTRCKKELLNDTQVSHMRNVSSGIISFVFHFSARG